MPEEKIRFFENKSDAEEYAKELFAKHHKTIAIFGFPITPIFTGYAVQIEEDLLREMKAEGYTAERGEDGVWHWKKI